MGLVQKPSRPISTGKDKPRGGAKTDTDPKGETNNNLGPGMGPVQKPPRPISTGKDKPRGGAKTATDPKGKNAEGTDRKGGPNLGSTSPKSNPFWTPIPIRL